ncbi:TadE/TadG family type IV pilus assembly protein [Aliiroseovarius sp. PTFE2010]|uniref:TadE/TadG family type IV pilus assembly protein n=1 Tax=Aliiroseovarius sp. PTFE2010 TaxID=3417190 RepID=UPI003CF915E9
MVSWFKSKFGAWRKDERGTVTVEFVILFPVFVTILLSGIEIGVLMSRQTMLERGVDLAVRELRLGIIDGGSDDKLTEDDVRKAICNHSGILKDCFNSMHMDLMVISTNTFNLPKSSATCLDKSDGAIKPNVDFDAGIQNDLMIIRACFVVDPFFPTSALGAQLPRDAAGNYQLVSMSAFVNEPS